LKSVRVYKECIRQSVNPKRIHHFLISFMTSRCLQTAARGQMSRQPADDLAEGILDRVQQFRFGGRDQRSMAPFDFVEGAGEHPHSVLLVNCIKAKRNGSSWKAITMAGGLTTMHIRILSSTFPLGPAVFAAGRPQAWQGCSCRSRRVWCSLQ